MSPISDPKSIESCSVSMNSSKKKMESDAGYRQTLPSFPLFSWWNPETANLSIHKLCPIIFQHESCISAINTFRISCNILYICYTNTFTEYSIILLNSSCMYEVKIWMISPNGSIIKTKTYAATLHSETCDRLGDDSPHPIPIIPVTSWWCLVNFPHYLDKNFSKSQLVMIITKYNICICICIYIYICMYVYIYIHTILHYLSI